MTVRSLFVTRLYEAALGDEALLAALEAAAYDLAENDAAGRRWCREHGYKGYTSYASLADLPERDPAFADLVRALDRHIASFAKDCALDLGGKRLKLDSIWVNVMKPGAVHTGHIHPHSIVSGTFYVSVPPGSGALKLEDPRLPMMMAAPTRLPDAPDELQPFVYMQPARGTLFLWESWLRHEVVQSQAKSDRISVSFNYRR